MPLSKDDRIAFSLKIVSADSQIKALDAAKAQLTGELDKLQKLDTANMNLFTPVNTLVNGYQNEFQYIDGNVRTVIVEQDIIDSANKKIRNHFFPNDTATSVPSLSALNNIWPRVKPFALGYGIGKNYGETYGSVDNENAQITLALGYITSAGSYTNIELTSGQQCVMTPVPNTIQPYPAVQTLKTNLVTAINTLKAALLLEVAAITTNDTNVPRQTQNNAAISNINTVIVPALNTWLAYVDFNTAHGQTTCAGFNAYNSNLLAPTKLHSTQLAALQSALLARQTFLSTRTGQLTTNLGTIVQDVNTGELTSSTGFYGQRYGFLSLRLNALGGSLTQLAGLQAASGAQDSIKANILENKATYLSILPTSILKAPGNGTAMITLTDTSLFAVGDSVWVIAEGQEELQRAIKSIVGDLITLNDVIPAKYRVSEYARIYKDLT